MAAITIQTIVEAGITPAYVAAAASQTVANDGGDVMLHVKNGSGGSINLTITAQRTSAVVPGMGSLPRADRVVAVGAGAEAMIGPFPIQAYNNSSNAIELAWSATTSVTFKPFRLPRAA